MRVPCAHGSPQGRCNLGSPAAEGAKRPAPAPAESPRAAPFADGSKVPAAAQSAGSLGGAKPSKPQEPRRPATNGTARKRELPPYLRVVK